MYTEGLSTCESCIGLDLLKNDGSPAAGQPSCGAARSTHFTNSQKQSGGVPIMSILTQEASSQLGLIEVRI